MLPECLPCFSTHTRLCRGDTDNSKSQTPRKSRHTRHNGLSGIMAGQFRHRADIMSDYSVTVEGFQEEVAPETAPRTQVLKSLGPVLCCWADITSDCHRQSLGLTFLPGRPNQDGWLSMNSQERAQPLPGLSHIVCLMKVSLQP